METTHKIVDFLSQYEEQVFRNSIMHHKGLFVNLLDITEQIDIPARMIAYCFGQKYSELICPIILSKKGFKPGFNWRVELQEPNNCSKAMEKYHDM
ncbi:MAG: hypothetical protein IPO78_13580 [Saprospiraceae bacterium]|nr:hypothetical protein [Saprospiraceae bacterium]